MSGQNSSRCPPSPSAWSLELLAEPAGGLDLAGGVRSRRGWKRDGFIAAARGSDEADEGDHECSDASEIGVHESIPRRSRFTPASITRR